MENRTARTATQQPAPHLNPPRIAGRRGKALPLLLCGLFAACADRDASPDQISQGLTAEANARGEQAGNDGLGLAVTTATTGMTRRAMTDSERADVETRRALRGVGPASAPAEISAPATATDRARARARALRGDTMISLSIQLGEPGAESDIAQLRTDPNREARIQTRAEKLRPSQRALAARIAARGGAVVSAGWLVNTVAAQVPAGAVDEIASWPGVESITIPTEAHPEVNGWNGDQVRNGVRAHSFISAGYDGNSYSRMGAGSPIRIGIVEQANGINSSHVGWLDCKDCGNRVRRVYQCAPDCAPFTPSPTQACSHGSVVSWLAAGSIEQGQDSTYPGSSTLDQRRRSGVAKEAHIYYYGASRDSTALYYAIEKAVADGMDVINMSWGLERCDAQGMDTTTYDNMLNAVLRYATTAGTLVVKSAGNYGSSSNKCTLTYPAWRPEVLSVAALETVSTNADMNTSLLWDEGGETGSSRGGAQLRISGSPYKSAFSGIGLAAPGRFDMNVAFGVAPNQYCTDWRLSNAGTSGAAAVVSGTAALLRDAIGSIGWSGGNDARILMTNMLLMGDAWDSDSNTDLEHAISSETGYGRLHAHWPSDANLTAPWGWGWRSVVVRTGDVVSWPVGTAWPAPASVKQWKWALTWFDADLGMASDIVAYVKDACDGDRIVSNDASLDFRKRIHLRADKITGKCLKMEVRALKTPTSGTTIYSADYFHSGSPTYH